MALHIHRAERTDLLADGLGALLSKPLADPFAEELVIVPAKGVERWIRTPSSPKSPARPTTIRGPPT